MCMRRQCVRCCQYVCVYADVCRCPNNFPIDSCTQTQVEVEYITVQLRAYRK